MRLADSRLALLLICLLALALRLAAVVGDARPPESDAITFHRLAVSLASGDGYARVPGHATAWVVPGYPLLLSGVYWASGPDPATARLANAFLGALTCFLVVLLGRRAVGPAMGLCAGLYAAISPFLISLPRHILSENLYIPLLLLAGLAFHDASVRGHPRDFLSFGLWASLSTLTKPLTVPFFLAALLFLLWRWIVSREVRVARGLAVTLAAFLVPLAVWTVRNEIVLGAFVPLSTQGGDTLYVSYNPVDGKIFGRRLDHDPVYAEANRQYPLLTHEVDRARYLTSEGIRSIREYPERLPRLTLFKILYFWSPFDWEIMEPGTYNASTAALLPFLVPGLLAIGREWPRSASLILPPASMFAIGLLFYGSPRVRLTVEPFLIVLGAGGAAWLWARVRRPVLLACAFAGWVALNGFLALSGETAKLAARSLVQAVGLW